MNVKLKHISYTQFTITPTRFDLPWSSSGSEVISVMHVHQTWINYWILYNFSIKCLQMLQNSL